MNSIAAVYGDPRFISLDASAREIYLLVTLSATRGEYQVQPLDPAIAIATTVQRSLHSVMDSLRLLESAGLVVLDGNAIRTNGKRSSGAERVARHRARKAVTKNTGETSFKIKIIEVPS